MVKITISINKSNCKDDNNDMMLLIMMLLLLLLQMMIIQNTITDGINCLLQCVQHRSRNPRFSQTDYFAMHSLPLWVIHTQTQTHTLTTQIQLVIVFNGCRVGVPVLLEYHWSIWIQFFIDFLIINRRIINQLRFNYIFRYFFLLFQQIHCKFKTMQAKKFFVHFCIFILIVLVFNFIYHIYRSRETATRHSNDMFFVKYFIKDDKFTNLINAIPFSCGNYVSLVIVVLCETKNIHQRNAIRNTWGQWLTSKYSSEMPSSINSINYHSNQTKLLFAMGSKTTALADIRADLEYLQNETYYDDVMYFPGLLDSYMNLTLKTLTGLNTARKKCPKASYFLKVTIFVWTPALK